MFTFTLNIFQVDELTDRDTVATARKAARTYSHHLYTAHRIQLYSKSNMFKQTWKQPWWIVVCETSKSAILIPTFWIPTHSKPAGVTADAQCPAKIRQLQSWKTWCGATTTRRWPGAVYISKSQKKYKRMNDVPGHLNEESFAQPQWLTTSL